MTRTSRKPTTAERRGTRLKCAWIPGPLYERVQTFGQETRRTRIGVIELALAIGLDQLEAEAGERAAARPGRIPPTSRRAS